MKAHQQTLGFLKTLSLHGVLRGLDELIDEAESRKVSYLAFLNDLLSAEIAFRVKRRVERNMAGAHFPVLKSLENFDFSRVKGIGKSEAVNLLDCRWIDAIFYFSGHPVSGSRTYRSPSGGRPWKKDTRSVLSGSPT